MNRVTGTDVSWVWYQMLLIPVLGNASFKLGEIQLPLPPNAWTIKYTGIWDLDEKHNILSECTKPWVWSQRPPKQQQCRSLCIIQGAKTMRYLKAQQWKKLECIVWLLNWSVSLGELHGTITGFWFLKAQHSLLKLLTPVQLQGLKSPLPGAHTLPPLHPKLMHNKCCLKLEAG